MKNTTELKGITVQGGWRNRQKSRFLGISIIDPANGMTIAEIELDQDQVLNLLSNTHDSNVAGEFVLMHRGLERIGMRHVMVDVAVPDVKEYGDKGLVQLNHRFENAWILAGRSPWIPVVLDHYNSHRRHGNTYNEVMHAYFPWDATLEEIRAGFEDCRADMFSNLRFSARNNV